MEKETLRHPQGLMVSKEGSATSITQKWVTATMCRVPHEAPQDQNGSYPTSPLWPPPTHADH
ncbi:hypothetical protein SAY86_001449 [Trapa natans]|uniref:Uncharacterized protein n=1 Tax=Trapa natans TaxID=22666 RepID=A0AAN7MGJ7_TRANT|nr:hypothetical protein SAY86_001449 [Trapa natans]